jgi:hypothetical protein
MVPEAAAAPRNALSAMTDTVRETHGIVAIVLIGAVAALAGCCSQSSAEVPRIEEKISSFTPATIPVQVGVMTGRLAALSVIHRVNAETGEVVYAHLRGTLRLKNTASDESLQLVEGKIDYLAGSGAPIAPASDRSDTSFRFHGYSSDPLDPGGEISHPIDLPFPPTVINGGVLKRIRLTVTYLPAAYKEDSAEVPVTVAAR